MSSDSGWKTLKGCLPTLAFALVRALLSVMTLAAVFVGNFPIFDVDCSFSSFPRHHCDIFCIKRAVKEPHWS